MTRFVRERGVQRNEIRICQQIIQLFDELHLQTARARGREIGIISNHAHAKGNRAPAQLASNSAHANHAESFIVKLDTFKIFPAPFLGAQTRVRLRNFSGDAEQE